MKFLSLFFGILLSVSALAESQKVRWTGTEDKESNLAHILSVIEQKTGYTLAEIDFIEVENRDLANNHFRMLAQVAAGLPIHGMTLRIWTDLVSGDAIQVEAQVENPTHQQELTAIHGSFLGIRETAKGLTSQTTGMIVRRAVKRHSDANLRSISWRDTWFNGTPARLVKAKARRGTHIVVLTLATGKVIAHEYELFPQADIPIQVFQVYEEVEGTGKILGRIPATLRHIRPQVIRPGNASIFAPLMTMKYFETMYDPILGETEEGRKKGYWAMSYVKRQAADIRSKLPLEPNSILNNGIILDGDYATVSLHPDVTSAFTGINFTPAMSSQFKPTWTPTIINGNVIYEMIPSASLLGRPIITLTDAWNRPARRLPDHDPASYINDGFDEIQVYYAIDTLFSSLHAMGFTDPELSTRPFNAFLYDPDIEMRDNAFYTDDTINFTTYSPASGNAARDNSTIWHELGHGVMDRLMGDSITLADTGGLSEGMADFVAALVIEDVTNSQPFEGSDSFRIINHTGFNLTNEVHDDGEAYGGTMWDFMKSAVAAQGHAGLLKVTDLTLEAMRLCRNNPGLTANDWFEHMMFADELGHPGVRAPGELHDLLIAALNGRNFSLSGDPVASYSLKYNGKEVVAGSPGSRGHAIPVTLKETETASFHLDIGLKDGANYKFKYPVHVKAFLRGGPLQGAIKWDNEATQPVVATLNSPSDVVPLDLKVTGTCDYVNTEDGSCSDFVYVQIWNKDELVRAQAKKRFYVKMTPKREDPSPAVTHL